jgi:hypothetical protein
MTLIVMIGIGSMAILTGCGEGEAPRPEAGAKLYSVVDGKVDEKTFEGWRTWRAARCERCHDGPPGAVTMGPSLVDSLRKLSRNEFKTTVLKGRAEKGMPSFEDDQHVVDNLDSLYMYLKGRSDGAIPPGKLAALGS